MLQRRLHRSAGILYVTVLLIGCGYSVHVKEKIPVFAEPQNEKKVIFLRKRLLTDPNDIEKRIKLARILLSEEDMVEDAIIELERASRINPTSVEVLLLLSLAYQKLLKPDFSKALEILKKAAEIEPENADAHLNLGQVSIKLKNEGEAIEAFKKAIALSNDPTVLVSAHLGLMGIYEKRGEIEKANEEYEAVYELYPGIEEIIKNAEINRITPNPKYAGEEFRDGEGLHPSFDQRIRQAIEELEKVNRR